MDRLRALRTFISVAEHQSFAEAGRRLNLSPTTVSRTIAVLESNIGVQLLRRTTRSVRLTDEGALFLAHCRAGIAEIDQAFDIVQGRRSTPSGVLTVTAPVMFGRLHIQPVIVELLKQYPELQIRFLLLDRVVNLVEEGIDVAVRIADLPDSSLHMLRVGEVRRVFTASPGYLAQHGRPISFSDLRQHEVIRVEDEAGPHRGWGLDEIRRFGRSARFSVNNMEAAISAAVSGLGVIRTMSYQVADELAAGRLVLLLTDDAAPTLPISLLFQSGRKNHPNVRAFIEAAKQHVQGSSL
ncbi:MULTISPECIES: LysR family transcriptional regulator [Halopseudomonas]|uniref:LysR family transcriptional regulator n=1 Tax=Halopseudomonas bauzanensis TaxID=653930 RepID=A0A4U0YE75_9GAMM|nr:MULTISPECIES: LysR family transcriptional regulator [Halopseudomonas]EZQ17292.1 LysR family transcriptional regulator [Halopseudomonas bauzanensis]TKA90130.1 LysR family transcriptional regulator [Halopseudomonas bauzanensis]WGK62856.1 LysR family transcriptional regulator [Halopseudomonas sp. SMJS2]